MAVDLYCDVTRRALLSAIGASLSLVCFCVVGDLASLADLAKVGIFYCTIALMPALVYIGVNLYAWSGAGCLCGW